MFVVCFSSLASENWQILDGLPTLPAVDLEIHRSPTAPQKAADAFLELLDWALSAGHDTAVHDRQT